MAKRNLNILMEAKGEISMKTQTVKSKKVYNRKIKHKNKDT